MHGIKAVVEQQKRDYAQLHESMLQAQRDIQALRSQQLSAADMEAKLARILYNLSINISIEQTLFSNVTGPVTVGGNISMNAEVDVDEIVNQLRQRLIAVGAAPAAAT